MIETILIAGSLLIPTIATIINVKKITNYEYKHESFIFFGIAKPWLFGLNFLMISLTIYSKLVKNSNTYISKKGTIILLILLIITLLLEKTIKINLLKKEKSASKIYSKEKNWYK